MRVTLGDVFVGIAAIAGGTGLLLSYRSSMAAGRKLDIVAELTRPKDFRSFASTSVRREPQRRGEASMSLAGFASGFKAPH